MQTPTRLEIPSRPLPVGTIVKLKVSYQHWEAGIIGLCFDITEFLGKTGVFVLFEDGECALFNVANIPATFDVVGFSTENCFYRHENYRRLKMDYENGLFHNAFSVGRHMAELSGQAAA